MRNLRTEQEITENWKGDIGKPVVSICCITYNHELYIEDALEGFLIQETDFPFEIIIHDDASTDKTADIIREYEAKYPQLIKPIFQTENQYSKGLAMNEVFNFPRAEGEYIALCEGDDFWTSGEKLAKQFRVFSDNMNVSLVCHQGVLVDKENGLVGKSRSIGASGTVDANQVLMFGGGFCLTASIMLRKTVSERMSGLSMPGQAGDVILQNLAVLEGDVVAFSDQYCAYRINHPGSYSTRFNQGISNEDNNSRYSSMYEHYCYMKIELSNIDPKLLRSLNFWFNRIEYITALGFLEQNEIKLFRKHAFRAVGRNMKINISLIIVTFLSMAGLHKILIPIFRGVKKSLRIP